MPRLLLTATLLLLLAPTAQAQLFNAGAPPDRTVVAAAGFCAALAGLVGLAYPTFRRWLQRRRLLSRLPPRE
jgi:hypothetical protein